MRIPVGEARRVLKEAPDDAAELNQNRLFNEALPPETRRAILLALAEKALAGDVRVAAFLFDRLYGRPAAAVKPGPPKETDYSRFDLRRLDDGEIEILAGLLEKALLPSDTGADAEGGGLGDCAQTVPPGSGCLCAGDSPGHLVVKTGRGRRSAAKA